LDTSFDPESKQRSKQWKHYSSTSRQNFKVQASAGKIMWITFWDVDGELLIDFMHHRVTATWFHYTDLLHKLYVADKEKC